MRILITIILLAASVSGQYRQLAGSSGSVAGSANSPALTTTSLAGQSIVGNASGGDYGTGAGLEVLLGGTIISLDVPGDPGALPKAFDFPQNFPNPFNPTTEFLLSLPYREHVRLVIYDRLGREAARLIDNPLESGTYSIHFEAPAQWSSGLYFAVIDAGSDHVTRKLVLLK